jgi:hypothetical protein
MTPQQQQKHGKPGRVRRAVTTVSAGIGEDSLDGATEQGTVTAGEYTAEQGPGGGGGGPRW